MTIEKNLIIDRLTNLKLRVYPDPILLKACRPVEKIDDSVRKLAQDMAVFMTELKWGIPMGISAPQVGSDLRIFVALGEVFINPEIVWVTKAPKNTCHEGCYSRDENNFSYKVERAPSLLIRWQDLNGKSDERRFNGLQAQVIQHELDHLDGKLVGI